MSLNATAVSFHSVGQDKSKGIIYFVKMILYHVMTEKERVLFLRNRNALIKN